MSVYFNEKTVVLRLGHMDQIDLSIEAVQRVVDGKPKLACDDAPLLGVLGILKAIRDYDPNVPAGRNRKEGGAR